VQGRSQRKIHIKQSADEITSILKPYPHLLKRLNGVIDRLMCLSRFEPILPKPKPKRRGKWPKRDLERRERESERESEEKLEEEETMTKEEEEEEEGDSESKE